MTLRQQVEALREEFLKLAEQVEQETDSRCAQVLLAASGLKMLENKLYKKEG